MKRSCPLSKPCIAINDGLELLASPRAFDIHLIFGLQTTCCRHRRCCGGGFQWRRRQRIAWGPPLTLIVLQSWDTDSLSPVRHLWECCPHGIRDGVCSLAWLVAFTATMKGFCYLQSPAHMHTFARCVYHKETEISDKAATPAPCPHHTRLLRMRCSQDRQSPNDNPACTRRLSTYCGTLVRNSLTKRKNIKCLY